MEKYNRRTTTVWVIFLFLLLGKSEAATDGFEGAVQDASEHFRTAYSQILESRPCSPLALGTSCREKDFVFTGSTQLVGASSSRLARACASTQLQSVWNEIRQNLSETAESLYIIDSGGHFISGYHSQTVMGDFCQSLGEDNFDPRRLKAYAQSISSPKTVAMVNLAIPDNEANTLEAIEFLLTETLSNKDYTAIFSPGVNFTEAFSTPILEATPSNVAEILTLLTNLPNPPPTAMNTTLQLLSEAIETLDDPSSTESLPSCYQALVVFLHSELLLSSELAEMITSAHENNDQLSIFLFVVDGLSEEEFASASRQFCGTKTVILELGGVDVDDRNRTLVSYLNYFYHGSGVQHPSVVWIQNNTAAFSNNAVTTGCVPLIDFNQATISVTGVLIGVLCIDYREAIAEIPSSCPSMLLDTFEFSFLRHAYQPVNLGLTYYQYHCDNVPTVYQEDVGYLELLESFLQATSLIGRFSFEIIQSEFNNGTCPNIPGRPLTVCENASDSMAFRNDPNFVEPVSFTQSDLIWSTQLEGILPLISSNFNALNSSEPLWQSVCASSYLLDPWQATITGIAPSTFLYGDYRYGYTQLFPAYQASDATCVKLEDLDARLQSWFAPPASGPKAVIVIVDNRFDFGDDVVELQLSVRAILNTLNQYDYFNVILTNGNARLSNSLLPGRETNLVAARDFINQSDFSPESRDPNAAIRLAIEQFNSSLNSNTEANFALIILTDNSFIDPSSIDFSSMLDNYIPFFNENAIRVFTFLFSAFQEGTLLKNVSCSTGGLYDRIHDVTPYETALRVTAYYHFFAIVEQPGTQWLEPFVDELTGLNSTRLCTPIYEFADAQESNVSTLLGVSCISIPVENFTAQQLQALEARVYNRRPEVMRPILTFEEENFLRGIHMCDVVMATSAESFRYRTENSVRLFRSLAEEAYTTSIAPGIESCPYGDRFYDSCSRTLQPPTSFSPVRGCNVSLDASSLYASGFLAGFVRQLNYSINAFRPEPVSFSRLCMSEALNDLWTTNQMLQEQGILERYYGDSTAGFLRYHPYSDCGLDNPEICETRAYDPRYRPWYVSAVSGPKTVYIIVHSTENDNFALMQHAASDTVNTLTHRDFVNVHFAQLGSGTQFSNSFLRSNNVTRQQLHNFIQEQQFSDQIADVGDVFTSAYLAFQNTYNTDNASNCYQTIILLTDSSLSQDLVTTIQDLKQNLDFSVDIFSFTFGGLIVDPTAAQTIACQNGGQWFSIGDLADVETTIHSYYNFYAAAVQNSGVVWSEYFEDAFTGRSTVSACLPVYDPSTVELAPLLLGVTCIDVDPARFMDFPDGDEVLRSLTGTNAAVCPSTVITEENRESLRETKCLPPPLTTIQEVTRFYRDAVRSSANLHQQAYAEVIRDFNPEAASVCAFESLLYDSCDITPEQSQQFVANASYDGLGVVFASSLEGLLHNGSINLMRLTSNQPFFTSLCPSVIERRVWERTTEQNNDTGLQFFISESGFFLTSPARQLSHEVCNMEYDPRFLPFYASTVSAYKDVVIIIDLIEPSAAFVTSIYVRAALYVLTTLSGFDYFTIIAGNANFQSMLVRADEEAIGLASYFLSTVAYETVDQHLLVERGFEILTRSRMANQSVFCQSVLLFITNREITEETLMDTGTLNNHFSQQFAKPVKVFVNTFGNPPQKRRELSLVCNNNGLWNIIYPNEFDDQLLLQQKVTSYYRVLAKAVVFRDPLWLDSRPGIFEDTQVYRLCLPVYDTVQYIGKLLGLSCVEVPLSLIQQLYGTEYLEDLIHSQEDNECTAVSLTEQEIDVLRPEGLKCQNNTPQPPTTLSPSPPTSNTLSNTPLPTESPTQPGGNPRGQTGSGLSAGAIVGIVLGAIAFIVLLAVATVAIVIWKWKSKPREGGFQYSRALQQKLVVNEDHEELVDPV